MPPRTCSPDTTSPRHFLLHLASPWDCLGHTRPFGCISPLATLSPHGLPASLIPSVPAPAPAALPPAVARAGPCLCLCSAHSCPKVALSPGSPSRAPLLPHPTLCGAFPQLHQPPSRAGTATPHAAPPGSTDSSGWGPGDVLGNLCPRADCVACGCTVQQPPAASCLPNSWALSPVPGSWWPIILVLPPFCPHPSASPTPQQLHCHLAEHGGPLQVPTAPLDVGT